jgi:hypothetical protein
MATKVKDTDLLKPIPPGISWTAPAKGRPWSQPPKMVKLSEVAQGYIDNLSSPKTIDSVIDALETGVAVASLAEMLMLTGVHKGIHSMDTGILVIPVIAEMLVTAAEIHGIDYMMFPDDNEDADVIPDRVIRQALAEVGKKKNMTGEEMPTPDVKTVGLMSRTTTEEM